MEEERLVMSGFREEEDDQESSLRPKTLREYVGQQAVKDSLNIYIQAASDGIRSTTFCSTARRVWARRRSRASSPARWGKTSA